MTLLELELSFWLYLHQKYTHTVYFHPSVCSFIGQDEFHSRLRFKRRGLVGMANASKDDNSSQFFFTLGRADELTNKHTLFGNVSWWVHSFEWCKIKTGSQ